MSPARVTVAPDTGWVEADDVVYVAALPDGPPLVLSGPGALVWRAAAPGGTVDEVVDRVAAATGLSADVVAADVEAFVVDLVGAGVLSSVPASSE